MGTGLGIISKALREKRVPAFKAPSAKRFFGRSGILPLHFCFFFSQTPSAESATEHGNAGTREWREREFSHADSADCTDFMGGCASRVSNFIFTLQTLLVPKALKLRERVPAMANPHKSERTRACGGKAKITSVPKGVN